MDDTSFEWSHEKDLLNRIRHGVSFTVAQLAFQDPARVIAEDTGHSTGECRYFCFGYAGGGILTVRFTWRGRVIRIIGAGYWRKGKRIYEKENQIHR